jgi:DNA repair protein RecO (recombination protein O)
LKPFELIKGTYELFAAFHSGFEPDLSGCSDCGCESAESFYLDVMNGAVVCSECMRARGSGEKILPETDVYLSRNIFLPISSSVLAALRYIEGASPARLFSFDLKERSDLLDLSRVGETYLQNHLERGFETLNFYKSVSGE